MAEWRNGGMAEWRNGGMAEFLGKWKAIEENLKAAEENWKAVAESRKAMRKVESQMVGMVELREWLTEWSNGRQKWLHTYYLRYTPTTMTTTTTTTRATTTTAL